MFIGSLRECHWFAKQRSSRLLLHDNMILYCTGAQGYLVQVSALLNTFMGPLFVIVAPFVEVPLL